jgi:hypothetical protein
LLPAAVLLSPAAADVLMRALRSWRWLRPIAWTAAVASVGIVAAVGTLRTVRYVEDPGGFLESETQNYADIQWMNSHLDKVNARVASDHKALDHLEIPWLFLDPTYEIELNRSEIDDPDRFLAACRRAGVTHLFGQASSFSSVRSSLRPIYQNPSSRLGGVRFFRMPPSEATAVFEIMNASQAKAR